MKKVKILLSSVLMFGLLTVIFVPSIHAAWNDMEVFDAMGGWSEDEGYFIDPTILRTRSSSPQSHTGQRESGVLNGTSRARAIGNTRWDNVNHFTRARMVWPFPFEGIFGYEILTDSGRQWGTGRTSATSPWFNATRDTSGSARTYWGN